MSSLFFRLILSCSLLSAQASALLASGGPLLESDIVCELPTDESNPMPLMVFRLYEAPSSEMRGEVLVYPDRQRRTQMLTSLPLCSEQQVMTFNRPIDLPIGAQYVMLCGVANTAQLPRGQASISLRENNAGYRAAVWSVIDAGSELISARLEQLRDGNFHPVFSETFVCVEHTRS